MNPTTAEEAAANGAQLLDEQYPGWHNKVDPDTLDIADTCQCICGQLGQYEDLVWTQFTMQRLGAPLQHTHFQEWHDFVANHGFWACHGEEITDEWRKLILTRREMDAMPVNDKEETHVPTHATVGC